MEIRLIAALDEQGGIGLADSIPWDYPEDLSRFRELTLGYPVVMGRKTYQSLPSGPLKGRTNLVISRTLRNSEDGAVWVGSPEEVLRMGEREKWRRIFIIGGEEIYRLFLCRAEGLDITRIPGSHSCDRFFPLTDWSPWERVKEHREGELIYETYRSRKMRIR